MNLCSLQERSVRNVRVPGRAADLDELLRKKVARFGLHRKGSRGTAARPLGGYVIMYCNGAIGWSAKHLKIVADSANEAETATASRGVKEGIFTACAAFCARWRRRRAPARARQLRASLSSWRSRLPERRVFPLASYRRFQNASDRRGIVTRGKVASIGSVLGDSGKAGAPESGREHRSHIGHFGRHGRL